MNLNKAIEILEHFMVCDENAEPVEFDKAIILGIEAGKRVLEDRPIGIGKYFHLLPSETEGD